MAYRTWLEIVLHGRTVEVKADPHLLVEDRLLKEAMKRLVFVTQVFSSLSVLDRLQRMIVMGLPIVQRQANSYFQVAH